MRHFLFKGMVMIGVVTAGLVWNGEVGTTSGELPITKAEARAGRPATPVSYAGVARRSTVGVGAPGAGAQPANRGGPVNRVGRR